MTDWDAQQYLKFADERTRPCRDLAARIHLQKIACVIDLGCGPGNSTAVLAEFWPTAEITGLDSSPEMIATARQSGPANVCWAIGDIAEWASEGAVEFDLVFSNAALQWLPDHAALLPRLLARAAPGGALAFQTPGNWDSPAHVLMRQLAASPAWRKWFPTGRVREWNWHEPAFYYDVVAPHAARVELWETVYIHNFPAADAIVEFYQSTGLRPFLQPIAAEEDRVRFLAEYREGIRKTYPPRADGRVLFSFRRTFCIAYR